MTLGEKLRLFGEYHCGNMKNFADELGLKQSNLSGYTTGQVSPGLNLLKKLLVMGCDINWLIADSTETEDDRNFANQERDIMVKTLMAQVKNQKELLAKFTEAIREADKNNLN